MSKCVFAGTFDPITLGHVDIVNKALKDFDEVIIGVGINEDKTPLLSVDKRVEMIKKVFAQNKKVSVYSYQNLTVDFAKSMGVRVLVRGVRNEKDLAYEKVVEDFNQNVAPDIKTVIYKAEEKYKNLSSTFVKDSYFKGEDISSYVPDVVIEYLNKN
ncbi:MAG: pantetheine-phosphate adenylyltransferase [Clostridia bacterium]|nr:pantetheine-phosphate adenylyltransferase [Clostridia bacterium]